MACETVAFTVLTLGQRHRALSGVSPQTKHRGQWWEWLKQNFPSQQLFSTPRSPRREEFHLHRSFLSDTVPLATVCWRLPEGGDGKGAQHQLWGYTFGCGDSLESVLQFKKNKTEQSENPVGTGAGDNDSQDDSQDLKTANHRPAPKQIFKPHNWDMQIFSLLALQNFLKLLLVWPEGWKGRPCWVSGVRQWGSAAAPQGCPLGRWPSETHSFSSRALRADKTEGWKISYIFLPLTHNHC